jgi:hypothetical protein
MKELITYNIENYSHLRKPSTVETVEASVDTVDTVETVEFPKDRVHWMNHYAQKEAETAEAIERVKVLRERSPEFRPSKTRIPLSSLDINLQSGNYAGGMK